MAEEREFDFDLIVIGSGPSGQKAAIQAAKLGRRVAVVERRERVGGVSIHTGTIPSKTLRQAVLELRDRRRIDLTASAPPMDEWEAVGAAYLRDRAARVVAAETAVVRDQLRRNRVNLLYGSGRFTGPQAIEVDDGRTTPHTYTAQEIVIAVGTVPARPPDVDFDDPDIMDSDEILSRAGVPRTLAVVGAGVIGVEYASMFAVLGSKVTLIDQRPRLLTFADGEITEALQYLLRRAGVTFRLSEQVTGVERRDGQIVTSLASGKQIPCEAVLFANGRQGATADLHLEGAGLEPDKRGRLEVDECGRTAVDTVFAVGDVAQGSQGLAATAFEQGRQAGLVASGQSAELMPELIPTGVYAIPELGMVGRTEESLTEASVPYVTGVARWNELARGLITGDEDGMLKILVSPENRALLGVHVLGTGAADLVHIGQALLGRPGGVDFLVSAVFNYPTFAESYKVAALDALNRMRLLGLVEPDGEPVPEANGRPPGRKKAKK
ncbi:MAG TPA: Si-specific NAD(P)(+) transhydrogenase [Solirubrobacteraceae bacterium]|jgi:NAD(P) transhydrogenase